MKNDNEEYNDFCNIQDSIETNSPVHSSTIIEINKEIKNSIIDNDKKLPNWLDEEKIFVSEIKSDDTSKIINEDENNEIKLKENNDNKKGDEEKINENLSDINCPKSLEVVYIDSFEGTKIDIEEFNTKNIKVVENTNLTDINRTNYIKNIMYGFYQ